MADFTAHLKSAAWTEVEVIGVAIGSVAAVTMLDTKKIFKKEFAANPLWFEGSRPGAPFKIKHFGAIKAVGAVVASTYVANPWIKLALMGVALQGTLEQVRMMSYDQDKQNYRFDKIGAGDAAQLDKELKALADQYRGGTQGLNDDMSRMGAKPDYDSSVAKPEYDSSVARSYDDEWAPGMARPFDLGGSDMSAAA